MKKIINILIILIAFSTLTFGQNKKDAKETQEKIKVPVAVKNALSQKYPDATKVMWEKEKGNYEANWGGKSGEDNSVKFTPAGNFIEIVNSIRVNQLPDKAIRYLKTNYKGAKIKEAGKITDAKGKIFYEAEVKNKVLIFDDKGAFIEIE